ncbi:SusC/RagA family TonB-linked outer membrane protein [Larkinella bovis]|uniref:SusC/RagA family TonB-linked outer membrane protein n=1 Tax=Larkinella bovis TaxID=683041 RepID=A0ABW0IDA1_9BACT
MKESYLISVGKFRLLILATMLSMATYARSIPVSGTVTDEKGSALPGVSILLKGSSKGATTDANGHYTIEVTDQNAVLIFSFLGYTTREESVGNRTSIMVSLQVDEKALQEVVVVGYGTQKKSGLTGAVTSISTKQMTRQFAPTIGSSLQGLAPGVEILQPGGIAGANAHILIRGAASFGSTAPLYVIDGAFSNSGLNSLTPNDIESIEVLKDGSAAAIYGSRAANGVVLITTKRGKKGDPVIDFSATYGQQTPSRKLDYLNAAEYRQFANQVADNSGIAHAPQNDNPTQPNTDTDWQQTWLQPAPMYSVNLGVSGGGEYTSYNTSVGFMDQKGLTAYSGFKRYDFRVNTSYKKNRLTVDESFSVSRQSTVPTANVSMGIPTVPVYNAAGQLTSSPTSYYLQNATVNNPLGSLHYSTRKRNSTLLIGSLSVGYRLAEGLQYKLTGGGSYNNSHSFTHNPVFFTLFTDTGQGISTYGNNMNSLSETRGDEFNYNIDNLLTYKKTLGKHGFDVLIGTSWVRDYMRANSISTISDLGDPNITGTGGTVTGGISAVEQQAALFSQFAKLNYDYDDRYLFSASIRNDISSKFAKANRSGWFPSVSAGWNLHNENWFRLPVVSQLKVRASYGELGANFIDPYQFNSSLLGPVPSPFGITPINFVSAYAVQLYPQDLRWETSVSKNIGADIGLFQNRLTVSIDYFDRTNKDLLASISPPLSSGQALTQSAEDAKLVPVNTASVQNKGIEIAATYSKRSGDFKWNLSGNFTALKNKVLELGTNVPPIVGPVMSGDIGDNITITQPRSPIGSFYGFEMAGLTDKGSIAIRGVDREGNPVIKPIEEGGPADKKIIGSPIPDFTYGLNFSSEYKQFDLTLFIQGVQGGDIFNWHKLNTYFNYNSGLVKDVLNSWTPQNTNTDIPKAAIGLASRRPSSFYIEDGSYLRLKNIQLGYTANTSGKLRTVFKHLRVFGGVQNLFTLTKYTGYDPEVGGTSVGGRTVNMTTTTRNADLSAFPNSRTFTAGITASF